MQRREFITLLGGTVTAWPLAARAQQPKRVGVLMDGVATGSVGQANLSSFLQGLRKLGWIDGENMRIEVRWNAGDRSLIEAYASDLVGLFKPDVLLAARHRKSGCPAAGYEYHSDRIHGRV
jgi:putative ABC transport system substrate-binding protein